MTSQKYLVSYWASDCPGNGSQRRNLQSTQDYAGQHLSTCNSHQTVYVLYLLHSALSVRVHGCQKLQITA